jgi:hypothetical protein
MSFCLLCERLVPCQPVCTKGGECSVCARPVSADAIAHSKARARAYRPQGTDVPTRVWE